VQSWNGAFNTVASIKANGSSTFGGNMLISGNIELTNGANRQIIIGSVTNYNYRLRTDGDDFVITEAGVTDRLRYSYSNVRWSITGALTVSDNLLVGTTTDAGFKLQVNGEGRFYQSATNTTAYLRVENNRSRNAAIRLTTTVGDYYLGVGIGADVNQFQIFDGIAGATRLTISSTGAATFSSSVTANGLNALGSSLNNGNTIRFYRAGLVEMGYIGWSNENANNSTWLFKSSNGNPIAFSADGTNQQLVVNTNGNVLIGTTTDSGYKLHVNGISYLNGYNYASSIQYTRAVSNTVNPAGGEGVLIFSGGQSAIRMNSNYTMNFDMYNGGNQFTALQIRQNGNAVSVNSPDNQLSLEISYQGVGQGYLGATASYGRALLAYSQNGGYVYLSSSSTWVAASDVNRKKNFESYNKGLAEICNLQPTLFNLKTQSDDEPKIAGLIAQQVGEHIQEAFSDGEFIGIDYNVLTVTIINAIKELKAELDELKSKN
jgi:hypothetical protein